MDLGPSPQILHFIPKDYIFRVFIDLWSRICYSIYIWNIKNLIFELRLSQTQELVKLNIFQRNWLLKSRKTNSRKVLVLDSWFWIISFLHIWNILGKPKNWNKPSSVYFRSIISPQCACGPYDQRKFLEISSSW